MKQILAVILALTLAALCAGCGGAPAPEGGEDPAPAPPVSGETEPSPGQQGTVVPEPEAGEKSRTLVVFFSATGHTRTVAEKIAELTGADMAEIVPAVPYPPEDLDPGDSTTRETAEHNTPEARPEIGEDISLEGYDTVYLGYPIWWGQAPRILSTFAESHDFTGITVIPFCTSGSSGIGSSAEDLERQAGSGRWLPGRRFPADVSGEDLSAWILETEELYMEKTLRLYIGETEVSVDWEENESAAALASLCREGPLTIQMSMYGGFEQVGPLGTALPSDDTDTVTAAGDIVLYSSSQIVIFYGSNSWAYTRLGRITDRSAGELEELLGNGNVTVTLAME